MKQDFFRKVDIDNSKLNPFRYKKINSNYLITNNFGFYHFLKSSEFEKYISGEISQDSELFSDLSKKGFVRGEGDTEELLQRFATKRTRLNQGPGLHIIVVALDCNYNCLYCQADSGKSDTANLKMDKKTAKKVVDQIFETPVKKITIEFQGGEPMTNWDVVKFIINYTDKKRVYSDKKVEFSLVTNLSLMTEERFDFLIENNIKICTSLDGPQDLQNKNRPYSEGDSYEAVKKWVKKSKNIDRSKRINAIPTISKFSLDKPKEIIDEYREIGYPGIHLRPLSNLGRSGGEASDLIGYSAEEFIDYWQTSMDYILKINKTGDLFSERMATIMLTKILTDKDPGYTDLSSPCGAVIGQVLYNYNGDLYTCDEARMIDDDTFKIGNIDNISYEDMIDSDTCSMVVNASILENQPCDFCAYKPYCGVCPVKNYALEGTLFPNIKSTEWCKLRTAQMDYLFEKLQNKVNKYIFKAWVARSVK